MHSLFDILVTWHSVFYIQSRLFGLFFVGKPFSLKKQVDSLAIEIQANWMHSWVPWVTRRNPANTKVVFDWNIESADLNIQIKSWVWLTWRGRQDDYPGADRLDFVWVWFSSMTEAFWKAFAPSNGRFSTRKVSPFNFSRCDGIFTSSETACHG